MSDALYVVGPEASHPAREWHQDSFYRFCQRLTPGRKVSVVGCRQPDQLLPGVADLRGKTDLLQLVGLIERASAVISMDSAIMHLAAALNVPTIALFGSVDPRFRMSTYKNVWAIVPLPLDQMPNKSLQAEGAHPIERISVQHLMAAIKQLEAPNLRTSTRILLAKGTSELLELPIS